MKWNIGPSALVSAPFPWKMTFQILEPGPQNKPRSLQTTQLWPNLRQPLEGSQDSSCSVSHRMETKPDFFI